MKYKVVEILRTLQGEGAHVGAPCTLVRLSGCNLSCSFCDTKYALQEGEWMTSDEIRDAILECSEQRDMVLLTGGEPALQQTVELASTLKACGMLHMETNGTIWPGQAGKLLDWITVSPKRGSQLNNLILAEANELKFLWSADSSIERVKGLIRRRDALIGADYKPVVICLQPLRTGRWPEDKRNVESAIEVCKWEGYRFSPQLHKLLGIS
jgi:organic radical activating enzyme